MTRGASLLAAVILLPCANAADSSESKVDAPIVRPGDSPDQPVWLPASIAGGGDSPDIRRLPEQAQLKIDLFLRAGGRVERGDCIPSGDVKADDELQVLPIAHDFGQVVARTTNVLLGEVVSLRPGFWADVPQSLAEIRITEVLKRSGPFVSSAGESFYVTVPLADFRIGRYRFCKTDSRWDRAPKKGDRVLAVLLFDPIVESPPIFSLISLPVEVFTEGDSGTAVVPSGLAERDALPTNLDFDALVARVREMLNSPASEGESK